MRNLKDVEEENFLVSARDGNFFKHKTLDSKHLRSYDAIKAFV